MRRLYTLFLYLLIPFILLRLFWKSVKLPAYRQRIDERFALIKPKQTVDVWIHAVSLGEVVAVTPLIDALLTKNRKILITTMTPTGSQQVQKRFGKTVNHQYVPYDLPCSLKRFFQAVQARVGIIMETELWPNMIHYAKKNNITLVLANARLSDKSFKQYKRLDFFFRPILNQFNAIWAQSELDAKRFASIQGSSHNVQMFGNIKFDIQTTSGNLEPFYALKKQWGETRPVVILASTHHNEEEQWLNYIKSIQVSIPNVLFLIAPRHPERFQKIYELCQDYKFSTGLRSQSNTITQTLDIIILDSLGELLSFYQMSDYAFVGGSLVPVGGHNVLEPIAVNIPVFCGPYMQNSKAICDELCAAQALQKGKDIQDLVSSLIQCYQLPELREKQIKNAAGIFITHKGAVDRYVDFIEQILTQS